MSSIKNNNFMTNVALMIMIDYLSDFYGGSWQIIHLDTS